VHPRAATQAVASDHTSLRRWALEPPRVLQPRTSPPWRGELRCCHVSLGPGPRLLAEVSSGATMCPMALGSASLRGELRCCHVSQGYGLWLPERGAPVLPRVPRPLTGCGLHE
jgi:hypothetical protein